MSTGPRKPIDFLPLKNDVLWLLFALYGGPAHGYALMQEVERRSKGAVRIQTGALYRLLHRAERQGLIEEADSPEDETDERRRYYALTELGARTLAEELARMRSLVASGVREGVLSVEGELV